MKWRATGPVWWMKINQVVARPTWSDRIKIRTGASVMKFSLPRRRNAWTYHLKVVGLGEGRLSLESPVLVVLLVLSTQVSVPSASVNCAF